MRKLFGFLACLGFSVALVGCQNATDKRIDKDAKDMKAGVTDEANAEKKAIKDEAAEENADINATEKAVKSDIDAGAKKAKEEAKEEAAEDDSN